MMQIGGDFDLAQKPLCSEHCRQLRTQDFDSDRPVVLEVLGQVHRSHPASTQFPLDGVAVS